MVLESNFNPLILLRWPWYHLKVHLLDQNLVHEVSNVMSYLLSDDFTALVPPTAQA